MRTPSVVIASSACLRDTCGSASTSSHWLDAPTVIARAPSATGGVGWPTTCRRYERAAVRLRVLVIASPVWISVRRSKVTATSLREKHE